MIRTIDIRLNAAHPELPLPEATTYQGAPSTAFLRGVPKACGQWQITAVSVAATFPDNSTTTRAAVLSAGDVWVVTIPACATSGRVVSGLRIMADGLDENGDAVTGFVLGVADLAVATFDIAPAPGETSYALRYFDNAPNPPHKVDVAKVDGALKYYDGTAWQLFADIDLSNYATKADATLTERLGEWTFAFALTDAQKEQFSQVPGASDNDYALSISGTTLYVGSYNAASLAISQDGLTATFNAGAAMLDMRQGDTVATRTALQGYQLGSQTDKPLASEAEAEELRTGKQDALTFDTTPTAGSTNPVTSGGVKIALDGKLSTSGGTMTGDLKVIGSATRMVIVGENDINLYVALNRSGIFRDGTANSKKLSFPEDGGTLALTADLPYALVTKSIVNGAVKLNDRTINAAAVSSSLASLTVNFPTATSGKARDFGLRITVASGITTAPQLVLPQGVTCENVDGAAPEIGADGKTTILYFTETAAGVFLVKGEVVTAIS